MASKTSFDPSTPLTLELKHGSQLHKVRLPTENLDKSKKYYVTFTIDKANGLQSDDVMQVKLYFSNFCCMFLNPIIFPIWIIIALMY